MASLEVPQKEAYGMTFSSLKVDHCDEDKFTLYIRKILISDITPHFLLRTFFASNHVCYYYSSLI